MSDAFDQAWVLLKATRSIEYDIGTGGIDSIFNRKDLHLVEGTAANLPRYLYFKPGPMPGFVFYRNPTTGTDRLITEQEAEKIWPSHIDTRSIVAPTLFGLKNMADSATYRPDRPEGKRLDAHFDEDESIRRFTSLLAPTMAHEMGHALDSKMGEGSFAQQEMPAHVLEMATAQALGNFDSPIIPRASSLLRDRLNALTPYGTAYPKDIRTSEDNPNYEYDITGDTIV